MYKTMIETPFFVVRWGKAELGEIAQISVQLERTRKSFGKPLVYVAIVPEDAPPPEAPTRTAMSDAMREALTFCSSLHFVLLGTGFKSTIQRSALAGIMLLGGQRGKVFVHENSEAALRSEIFNTASVGLKEFMLHRERILPLRR